MEHLKADFEIFVPTNQLRYFVDKDGYKILQQGHQGHKGTFKWEDVQIVEHDDD